ncbi:hypothetical protein [Rubricoccus marinus]|nr:hypothetical protein [Rubricoccus marinus]
MMLYPNRCHREQRAAIPGRRALDHQIVATGRSPCDPARASGARGRV